MNTGSSSTGWWPPPSSAACRTARAVGGLWRDQDRSQLHSMHSAGCVGRTALTAAQHALCWVWWQLVSSTITTHSVLRECLGRVRCVQSSCVHTRRLRWPASSAAAPLSPNQSPPHQDVECFYRGVGCCRDEVALLYRVEVHPANAPQLAWGHCHCPAQRQVAQSALAASGWSGVSWVQQLLRRCRADSHGRSARRAPVLLQAAAVGWTQPAQLCCFLQAVHYAAAWSRHVCHVLRVTDVTQSAVLQLMRAFTG